MVLSSIQYTKVFPRRFFSFFFGNNTWSGKLKKKKKSYLTLILYEMGLQEIQETEQYIFFPQWLAEKYCNAEISCITPFLFSEMWY